MYRFDRSPGLFFVVVDGDSPFGAALLWLIFAAIRLFILQQDFDGPTITSLELVALCTIAATIASSFTIGLQRCLSFHLSQRYCLIVTCRALNSQILRAHGFNPSVVARVDGLLLDEHAAFICQFSGAIFEGLLGTPCRLYGAPIVSAMAMEVRPAMDCLSWLSPTAWLFGCWSQEDN